jgi:hypothetical protein
MSDDTEIAWHREQIAKNRALLEELEVGNRAGGEPSGERKYSRAPSSRSGAYILTVTLRFSPSLGSSPVNLALANSKAVTTALAGPSHNSAR